MPTPFKLGQHEILQSVDTPGTLGYASFSWFSSFYTAQQPASLGARVFA